MNDEYLFESSEFNAAGRASETFSFEGDDYLVEEEKVVTRDKFSDITVLRVYDESKRPVVAATYMNGLENRTSEEYDGMDDPLNELDEFDNPLHAVNQITDGELSDRSFSQSNGENLQSEELELLEV